jgi:DNA-binding transcriptional LysR family regulator
MLRQLKYFQAVVRCGSFTEAAAECHISQSAISQQIQALEQMLGVQLLKRGNRTFTVTPAGEYFYQKSLLLTADFEKLCRETAQIARQQNDQLRVGYLKGYTGSQFRNAVAKFSAEFPDVSVQIIHGNHEELYDALRSGQVDLVLSDQRRAFSDEYVNLVLTTSECFVEISERNPLAGQASVETSALRDIPCVLVASQGQQENERAYYRDVVGLRGEFLFAENLEEARLQVLGSKVFLPVEGEGAMQLGTTLRRIPLMRNGKPIKRTYCVFWKADHASNPIERFAEILKSKF